VALSSGVSHASTGVRFHDADGIQVVSVARLDPRQYDVRIRPAALDRVVHVRVLVPSDYGARRYPVLYLLHGTSGGAADWVTAGDAEATTAGRPLITVMPDGGFNDDGGGWYTNWVDKSTALGPSQWETFHIDELIPWIDANLRTVADRDGRAVAGLSQGGFGAMSYAARHPDMFVSAGSFSGAPNINRGPAVYAGATAVIETTAVALDGVEPAAMFGSRLTDEINWVGHDPADLATNLRGMSLSLYTGNGLPGPLDTAPDPAGSAVEALAHISTDTFHQRLVRLGIPSRFDDYGPGTHSWPYWARDLRQYMPALLATFAHPPAAPAVTSYESVAPAWSQWGWSVRVARARAEQFSALTGGRRTGFTLSGTGVATVTTPALYRPGERLVVTAPRFRRVLRASAAGRLTVTLPIAPGGVSVRVSG
jgi:S-formylglutathione hydrolase FrmB